MTEIEQLRKEVQELKEQLNKKGEPTPWHQAKKSYSVLLNDKYSTRDSGRIENAINTFIRYKLQIDSVVKLEEKDIPKAEEIAFSLFEMLGIKESHLSKVSNE